MLLEMTAHERAISKKKPIQNRNSTRKVISGTHLPFVEKQPIFRVAVSCRFLALVETTKKKGPKTQKDNKEKDKVKKNAKFRKH